MGRDRLWEERGYGKGEVMGRERLCEGTSYGMGEVIGREIVGWDRL